MTFEVWPGGPGRSGGGGGGATIIPAALQPNLFSALGMWSFLGDGVTPVSGIDRSGNGNNFGATNANTTKDLIPGQHAIWVDNVASSGWSSTFDTTAFKRVEFTVTMRVLLPFLMPPHGTATLACAASFGSNVEWDFVWNQTGLFSFWQHGSFVGETFQSTLTNNGGWHFVSYRRRLFGAGPSYQVTLGMDSTFQTSGAITPPDGTGTAPTLGVGGQAGGGSTVNTNSGVTADVCIWPSYLTDANIATLQAVAMGNAAFQALAA